LRLPPTDAFGNRWFGEPAASESPAILRFSSGNGYMLSLGAAGMHWTGGKLTRFKRPVNALVALNRALGGGDGI
jgi:hypothetical protein